MAEFMDGILVIDKPKGITSHDVVSSVRRVALTRKVGHAGTLDPFATGVLVVGFNQGTKALTFLTGDEKEYEATLRLGIETDTLDRDGRIVKEATCPDISYEYMEKVLNSFMGRQAQIPPKFSAIKKDGVPFYKLARKGVDFEVPAREIEIYGMTLLNLALPDISFRVRCSSGTYVRSLARDIGIKIGCGGHLEALRRVRSGRFTIDMAVPLDRLKEMGNSWSEVAVGLREALSLPEVDVDQPKAGMIRMGKELTLDDVIPGGIISVGMFMLTYNKELVAVAEAGENRKLHLLRVFNPS
ncbi:MAG TPA: tRNA pseudouridine(55) synthase TruB [Thermodesulfobacteriota bacterium]|nr:tRNA pseudouridine(55) synthase TruB [Thermodesulfobacteriota bacterium]